MTSSISILHLHGTFEPSGKAARVARLMAAFGTRARHVTVSADPHALGALATIPAGIAHEVAQNAPPLAGRPSVARYEAIARSMQRFDLVLTYGWDAIDGVMARRVFGTGKRVLPPLVHHEDGFGPEEATGLKLERNLYRRMALPAAHALAVPSATLERIALGPWKQPAARVHRIVNGIATAAYAAKADPRALPGFRRESGEVAIAVPGPLVAAKNPTALVRAAGGLSGRFRLVFIGAGPERDAIMGAAAAMGIADRVSVIATEVPAYRWLGLFDMVALPSVSEQFPTAIVEAMAAGLPVAAMPVGDIPAMVSPANRPFVAEWPTEVRLRDAVQALMNDEGLRREVGAANRALATASYDEAAMIAQYRALYEGALGRPGALG
ncbi:glycosyltransferase family 4 protein [Sphingomonas sp. KR1UV-12]|uniref:Glycosyltransferase family 4 protein n=1 Tax=Sphingomonas aurea TaxID=3063994 RepID=A0ABT9EGI0_9SPHN|nr:glycosyltransferase family 4 protein [Sphingomonas sp. KR1UV-12]MDP1025888.1 glycosyltransferase family 4 protein [Sphingomonas sp. KR1UV-12]